MSGRRIGVAPIARATFDLPFAEEVAAQALASLDRLDAEVLGPRDLLTDAAGTRDAIASLQNQALDLLLVLQVTFTDAAMTVAMAGEIATPLALWAFPEPRTGGRLRLNSLCGINLAGHALARAGRAYHWMYRRPGDPGALEELGGILVGRSRPPAAPRRPGEPGAGARRRAAVVRQRLSGARIGIIGRHPEGFDTCAYDSEALAELTGVAVDHFELPDLFAAAAALPEEAAAAARRRLEAQLEGLDAVDGESLDKSLRLHVALGNLVCEHRLAGVAMRCWPECFTEYGSAACAPLAMLNDRGMPGACEADLCGNITALILQWLAGEPAFIADLVDLDADSDTGVFWHCGSAPLHMADPEAPRRAAIHSNRLKPLLNEFPLRPGRVTIARFSQARGRHQLVIGGGEMLRAPLSFSGTSGVVRFDAPVGDLLDTVMAHGLEHHYGIVYGDFRDEVRALAHDLGLPVIELG
jgi:hypothetical protein